MSQAQETFLLVFTIFCQIAIFFSVVFIIVNWWINFYRREDLPAKMFIPYLVCEFWRKKHTYYRETGESYFPVVTDSGGHEYLGCYHCFKMRRYRRKLNGREI